jgi:hypothetical protein
MYDSNGYRLSRRGARVAAIEIDGERLVETGKLVRIKTFALLEGREPILLADVWLPPLEVIRIARAAEESAERDGNQWPRPRLPLG